MTTQRFISTPPPPITTTDDDWNHSLRGSNSEANSSSSSSGGTPTLRKPQYDSSATVATEETLSVASSSSTSSVASYDDNEQPFKVSLWLLPPEHLNQQYQDEIDRLSLLHSTAASGISFAPHVTIVGGIAVESQVAVDALIETLRLGLRGFGQIECTLHSQVEFETTYNASSGQQEAVWNQAAAMPLEQTVDFMQLCYLSRQLLGLHDSNDKCLFPEPIHQPHMSLYYGRHGVPQAREIHGKLPTKFVTNRVALWKTSPSDNEESVPEWRELAIFEL